MHKSRVVSNHKEKKAGVGFEDAFLVRAPPFYFGAVSLIRLHALTWFIQTIP